MSGWNVRVLRHDEESSPYVALHEVYYNKKGEPTSWTEEPIRIVSETEEELKLYMDACLSAWKQPVLNVSDLNRN